MIIVVLFVLVEPRITHNRFVVVAMEHVQQHALVVVADVVEHVLIYARQVVRRALVIVQQHVLVIAPEDVMARVKEVQDPLQMIPRLIHTHVSVRVHLYVHPIAAIYVNLHRVEIVLDADPAALVIVLRSQ